MKAIFLDRDGVINKYPGDKKYVTRLKEFRFLPRAKEAIATLHRAGFKTFVVSNQAGVGKGLFSQKALDLITSRMLQGIEESGGKIDAVYYCTHRKEKSCSCRKPQIGLLHIAKKEYPGINFSDSFFIGDTMPDMQTAEAAGCKSILVLSGKEKISNRGSWSARPDFVFKNLWEAAIFILKQK